MKLGVEPRSGGTRLWLAWLLVSAALVVTAFVAGQNVRSPWADAESNARETVYATAVVTTGEVSVTAEAVMGTLSQGERVDVAIEGAGGAARDVVTRTHVAAGDVVSSGQVLVEISDRPIIALQLPFPLYRDLHVGDSGADVTAVQLALSQLGLYGGAADGVLGPLSAQAVTQLYVAAGAAPPPVSAEASELLRSLEVELVGLESLGGEEADPAHAAALAELRRRVQEARDTAGPWLPVHEVLAIPAESVVVSSSAAVGTVLTPDGPAPVSLVVGNPTVSLRVGLASADEYVVGRSVLATSPGSESGAVTATVVSVSDFRPGEGADGAVPGYDVVAELSEDPEWVEGASVQVVPDTAPAPVEGLLVPLTAVRSDDDGTYVLVLDPAAEAADGVRREPLRHVGVEVGAQGAGVVVVAGDLREGERVVVGVSS